METWMTCGAWKLGQPWAAAPVAEHSSRRRAAAIRAKGGVTGVNRGIERSDQVRQPSRPEAVQARAASCTATHDRIQRTAHGTRSGHPPGTLPDRRSAGCRRYGRGLSRQRRPPEPDGGAQGTPGRSRRQRRAPGPLHPGGAARFGAPAPEHHHRLRHRVGRERRVPGDGAGARTPARHDHPAGRPAAARRAPLCGADRGRARGGAPRRHRPPRSQTEQHHGDRPGSDQDPGLRPGHALGRRPRRP